MREHFLLFFLFSDNAELNIFIENKRERNEKGQGKEEGRTKGDRERKERKGEGRQNLIVVWVNLCI